MKTELNVIKAAIYEMGLLFNQKPDDEKITAYAKALKDFTPAQICFAFNQVIKSGSAFFPSLAEILKHLSHPSVSLQDRAPAIAAEVLKLINDFSSNNEAKMLEAASPDARLTFEALGSTYSIRMSENIETTRAQIERLARSAMANKEATKHMEQLARIGIHQKSPLIEANGMRKLDFGDAV